MEHNNDPPQELLDAIVDDDKEEDCEPPVRCLSQSEEHKAEVKVFNVLQGAILQQMEVHCAVVVFNKQQHAQEEQDEELLHLFLA
ncbi:hypothetical protein PM082_012462 [Marasmius tenuissimus]|nr:hypothetical protein PM082_012462 [Marasmius tenuissimus]